MKPLTAILAAMLLLAALPANLPADEPATSPAATQAASAAAGDKDELDDLIDEVASQPASAPATAAASEPSSAPASEPSGEAASQPSSAPAERPAEPERSWRRRGSQRAVASPAPAGNDYRVIYERNIFLKDRTPRPVRRWEPPRHTPAPPPPPRQIVLTGVTIREKVKLAYFEDSTTGDLVKAMAGDTIQDAKIVDVLLDGVEIELKGEKKCLAIGMSILGNGPVDMSSASTSGSTGSSASSSTDSTSSSGGDDILERMRKRRQKELKP